MDGPEVPFYMRLSMRWLCFLSPAIMNVLHHPTDRSVHAPANESAAMGSMTVQGHRLSSLIVTIDAYPWSASLV
jgi:hypothetical protein